MTLMHAVLFFLISLHAVGHALLALDPRLMGSGAIAILLASVFGFLFDRSLGGGPEVGSRRVRGAIWGIYGAFLIGAFSLVTSGHAPGVALGLYILLGCQVGFLIVPSLDRGRITVLINAQALCALASLVGGVVAISALAGHAVLVVIFLGLDHRARRDQPLARAARGLVVPLVLVAVVLGLAFVLEPPRPNRRLLETVQSAVAEVDPGAVLAAWAKLIGVGLAGLGLLLLARKLLRAKTGKAQDVEIADVRAPRVRTRPSPAGRAVDRFDLGGARGRVVRAYLDLLRLAERRGVGRRPEQTPAEHAVELPGPARTVARLFGRARYGGGAVGDDEADAFDRAAREVARALKQRR